MWTATNFRISGHGIPTYQLNEAASPEFGGLSSWEIEYDQGHHRRADGSRHDISFIHRHPHFEIFWIRQGQGTLSLDFERLDVRSPSLLIVGPGEVHSWEETCAIEGSAISLSQAFTSRENFYLPFSQLVSFLRPRRDRLVELGAADQDLIASIFSVIRDPAAQSAFDRREVVKALLLILFSAVPGGADCGAPGDPRGWHSAATREFMNALRLECPPLTTVKELASFMRVSRSFLHRSVLRDTGRSPGSHIRDRLVLEAKRLLAHTDDSASQIGLRLGFRSSAYFSSFFRRHAHALPRDFRAAARGAGATKGVRGSSSERAG